MVIRSVVWRVLCYRFALQSHTREQEARPVYLWLH